MSNFLTLDGTAANYVSTTVPGLQNPTSTVEMRMRATPADYSPLTFQRPLEASSAVRRLIWNTVGTLTARVEVSGASTNATSTASVAGTSLWVNWVWDLVAGTCDFGESAETTFDDTAVTFGALGAQVAAVTTGTADDFGTVFLGAANAGGGNNFVADIFRVVLIEDGVRVFDYDVFRRGGPEFTDAQGVVWSMTGSAWTYTDSFAPHTAMMQGFGT